MRNLILTAGFVALATFNVKAQDLEQVKKTIDVEKFSEARKTLKNMIAATPDKGKNYFYLGQVYLALDKADSAKIYFVKGAVAKENAALNQVGLGHLDLLSDNATAAEAKFAIATAAAKKKDVEDLVFISKAYLKAKTQNAAKAIEYGKKATTADPNSSLAQLTLGEAYSVARNGSDAYSAYRTAGELDPTNLRAKMQLAITTRNAQAYPEAIDLLNKITAANSNYGPAYRELAETNLAFGLTSKKIFDEKIALALEDYKKYMALTDSSVDSKTKYAEFLVLSKRWTELEQVGLDIQKSDKANPKILRYLGYAFFETGKKAEAEKYLTEFINKPNVKPIGKDFMFLAKSKIANASDANGVITNQAKFNEAITDITKAAELSPSLSPEFTEMGISLFKNKAYLEAAKFFTLAANNPASKSIQRDKRLIGDCILYHIEGKSAIQLGNVTSEIAMADKAYTESIALSGNPTPIYLNKARLNRNADTPATKAQAVLDYEGYITAITSKNDAAELAKPETIEDMYEAYTFSGASFAGSDKTKALDLFTKALALKPTDEYAKNAVQAMQTGGTLTPKGTKTPVKTETTPVKTPIAPVTPQKKK